MSNKLQSKYKYKYFINHILAVFNTLFVISFSVIFVLNLTPIYKWTIYKYNLLKFSELTVEELMHNYQKLITYLQNPFIEKLYFNNCPISKQGEIHFYDVKRIFMYINIYIFLIMISLGIYILIKDKIKYRNYIKWKEILNNSANYILIIFTFLILCILINFSQTFNLFHKIIFKNNYWVFDSNMDPIINVLPEEFFMIMSILILLLILIYALVIKIYYYKKK